MGGFVSKGSHKNNKTCNSQNTVKAINNKSMAINGQQPGSSGYSNQPRTKLPTTITTSSSDSLNSLYNTDDDDHDEGLCRQKISIESLISSSSGSSTTSKKHGESYKVDDSEFSLADLSKSGATCPELSSGIINSSVMTETEQERLFREEQERLEKENQQKRAKTARLKRRFVFIIILDVFLDLKL